MEDFELVGIWWLPLEPSTKFPGTLTFDPTKGAELLLLGAFSATQSIGEGTTTRFAIIHGYATGSYQHVTLSNCFVQVESVEPVKDLMETQLSAERIFMSKRLWLSDIEDAVFETITVGFTHLSDWMIQDNSTNRMQRVTEDSVNSYKGRYILQGSGESLYDNAKIEIRTAKTVSHVGRTERSVTYEFRCIISPRERLHLNEYLPIIDFYLPNFFTLATGRANYPLNIVGGRSDASADFHIFYRIPGNIVKKQVTIFPGQMLFTFKDVREKLAKCLAAWIRNGENCGQYMNFIPNHITVRSWTDRPSSWT